jgi:hypothetical protein
LVGSSPRASLEAPEPLVLSSKRSGSSFFTENGSY